MVWGRGNQCWTQVWLDLKSFIFVFELFPTYKVPSPTFARPVAVIMKWESVPVEVSAISCIWNQSANIYERSSTTVARRRNKVTIQIDDAVVDLDPGLIFVFWLNFKLRLDLLVVEVAVTDVTVVDAAERNKSILTGRWITRTKLKYSLSCHYFWTENFEGALESVSNF